MKIKRGASMSFTQPFIEEAVEKKHVFRKLDALVDFGKLAEWVQPAKPEVGRVGYGLETGLRCILLQFYSDLSDREFEIRLRYDLSYRWFTRLPLEQKTPDHCFLGRMRKAIGTNNLGKIFNHINEQARKSGWVGDIFAFVDSTAIVTKQSTWDERDKATAHGDEKLNNQNISQYSADPDARYGCKGKDKHWFGYKNHISRDMRQGLITKVAVTPANVTDGNALCRVCPLNVMVFADKGYCGKEAQLTMMANGCHSGAIMRNNMKGKNRDKDRWLTRIRSPFEDAFSKQSHRARYRGIAKMQFQAFMAAIIYNLKRLVTIGAPPLFAGA